MQMWHFSVYAHCCCRVQQLLGRAGILLGWDMALLTLLLPEMPLALGECHHELYDRVPASPCNISWGSNPALAHPP